MGLHKGESKSPFARGPGRKNSCRGGHGGYEMPPGRWGAGESAASPLPRSCCSTIHILHNALTLILCKIRVAEQVVQRVV